MVLETNKSFSWQSIKNNKIVRGWLYPLKKLLYRFKILRPAVPHEIGTQEYRKSSSWDLKPNLCPCDLELIEYLKKNNIENQVIFHFGTGSHHIVGLDNHKLSKPNEIIGITAAVDEHQAYVNLCFKERALMKYYKVIFADIYTLTDRCLPPLDIVSLFHLSEFYFPEEAPFIHHDDESLLQLFLDKLNFGGKILFFTKSFAWGQALSVVQSFEQKGKIEKVEEYKSLLVYSKKAV